MSAAVDVLIERESANDADAVVARILVPSGSPVDEGAHIFDIETSKATQEIVSPAKGFLVHALSEGETVDLGAPVARVVADLKDAVAPTRAPAPAALVKRAGGAPRLSKSAAALAAKHGIDPSVFDKDLVSLEDVEAFIARVPAAKAPPSPAPTANANTRPLDPHKAQEMRVLGGGAGASLLSVIGVTIDSGLVQRKSPGFFQTKIIDLLASEASKLLAGDYSRLNAAYRNGGVEMRSQVNAGVAFDGGGRLVVYGVENSDKLSLVDLQDEIFEGFRKYAENKLTAKELTRATFSITDLSGTPADYVLPLLPEGQTLIIGIVNGPDNGYRLFGGFDHRVTEGRVIALFLGELRERIMAHLRDLNEPSAHCAFCGAFAADKSPRAPGKGLLRVLNSDGETVFCCRSCWEA